jgi:hypothetical protein
MTDAFEEVEEKLREDKLSKLWRTISPWLFVGVFSIVAGVGVNEYLGWQNQRAIKSSALRYEAAVKSAQEADYAGLNAALSGNKPLQGGFAVLAAQLAADAALAQGEGPKVASDLLKAGAKTGKSDILAASALLKSVYIRSETITLAEAEAELAPLIDRSDGIAMLAREFIAFKAHESGDVTRARSEWEFLKLAPQATEGVQQRAELALLAYPEEASGGAPTPAPAAEPQPAP